MNGVIFHCSSSLHLFDHAAPFSDLLGIPLIYTQDHLQEPLQKYYPTVSLQYIPQEKLDFAKLAQTYDFFVQPVFWRENLLQYFGQLLQKPLLFCYLSHGDSDKGHLDAGVMGGLNLQEVAFFSGEQSKDRLIKQGHWDTIACPIFTGNYRFNFYQKHQTYLDLLAEQEIFSQLNPKNPTLFYAPTWKDVEDKTSFYVLTETLLQTLPSHWNLLIKPHPLLEERDPARFYQILREENRENFLLLQDFPLIYPLLQRCDAYLGDFSSIGYDALFFQKPLFFYDPYQLDPSHPSKALHSCGISIPKENVNDIYSFIETHSKNYPPSLREKQKERAVYTFGQKRPSSCIKKEIYQKLETFWEAKVGLPRRL